MFAFAKKLKSLLPAQSTLPGRAAKMDVPAKHFVNGHPLEAPFPEGMQLVQFGMGCFWGAERLFWTIPGVYSTAVGYSGGETKNPTYEEVCSGFTNHAETVLVVFDPKKVSYEDLLRVFWEGHDPTQGMRQGNDAGTQYRSAIYTYGDQQQQGRARVQGCISKGADQERLRRHHHRDPAVAGVLLRRGLPPAIPRQEPERLLRPRRHRRLLPGGSDGESLMRIDKWLWAARFFKTRSLARQAVDASRVKVSGEKVKPAYDLKVRDAVSVRAGDYEWHLVVKVLSERRGPAVQARLMYEETEESRKERERRMDVRRFSPEPARSIKGRPTKKDRRDLDDWTGDPGD